MKFTTSRFDGSYTLYVPDGTYRVGFATWQGRWPPIYYDGASSVEAATDIVVAGADVPNINAAFLSVIPESGPAITGTVTVLGTGAPAAGITVSAWRETVVGWVLVKSKETRPDGTYALYVPEGTYRVGFKHNLNRYRPVFYDGAATLGAASDVIVTTDGAPNVNAQLVENPYYISGTLTADALPELPPGPPPTAVTAWSWNAPLNAWDQVSSAFIAPDGSYVALRPGRHLQDRASSPSDRFTQRTTMEPRRSAEANDVIVAGGNVSNINAHLRRILFASPWPAATNLSGAGQDAWGPQVAAGPDGAVTAVWYRRDGRNSRVQMATLSPNEYWSPPTDLSLPGRGCLGSSGGDGSAGHGGGGLARLGWSPLPGPGEQPRREREVVGAGHSFEGRRGCMGSTGGDGAAWHGSRGLAPIGRSRHQVQASTRVAYGPWSSPVMLSTAGGDASEIRG